MIRQIHSMIIIIYVAQHMVNLEVKISQKILYKTIKREQSTKYWIHDLRHTYATLLLINNYDLKAVSQLLGHASTIITSNIYFDKNKVIIDCTDEMNKYINRVKPKDKINENCVPIEMNLDTNLVINKIYLKKTKKR